MTDISITAGNVVPGADAEINRTRFSGASVTAGQWVYLDPDTRKWLGADANSATQAARTAGGVALHAAAANQPLAVQTGGSLTMGGTLTPGVAYYLSENAGGMCPVADVGSGEYVCLLGIALTASVFRINIDAPNVSL